MRPEDAAYCQYCGWSVDIAEDPPPAIPPPVAEVAPPAAVAVTPVMAPAPPKVKSEELFQISIVPLTAAQQRVLLDQIIWPPLALLLFAIVIRLLANKLAAESGGISPDARSVPMFANLLIGIILLTGILRWLRHLRDLGRGVAHVQLTRLTGTISRKVNNTRLYYGFFENLGKIVITSGIYGEGVAGAIYRLTYSPVSKRLWEAELIEQPAQPIPEPDNRPLPH
jgi:hypothetical protein